MAAAALVLTACGTGAEEPAGSAPPVPSSAATATSAAPTATATTATATVPAVLKFTGTTLDGEAFDGATLAGKPVVFWFWAPWCPKCQAEGPAVAKAAAKYGDKVRVVGIAGLDKSKDAINQFVDRTGTSGIVHLDDRTGALYKHFGVTSQSSYRFVSPGGGTESATGPLDERELADLIDQHTA
ncbi:thiol:disulfide interchange protein [Paractinoplanes deccanensis]|uniref:Thiol:disulfide interchange protein n=2 Tax=Paractinoplanes deccanensis TaxID=113561 RepID=A0ABQ3Y449_9ACTN|nr:thiol:disulfide interchange protein [Actinoplanes deccanensis]